MRQLGGTLRRALDDLDLPSERILRGQLAKHEVATAADGRQQVVEVVSHAGRELADTLHLLRLPQLFRQCLLRRNVPNDAEKQAVLLKLELGHREVERERRAVLLPSLNLPTNADDLRLARAE